MNVLPRLSPIDSVTKETRAYLAALSSSQYSGDIEVTYGSRLAFATDNSIYQQLPQAVVMPKNIADLQLIAKTASAQTDNDTPAITFSARGGGTGTNGQSLTPGIVVDTSRYMNQILELNLSEQWVRVEAGVIKDVLNDFLRPHGYFFCPDLSTSNRATLGGMISTDASGQGSLVYGKTSDHLLGLETVLASGELLTTHPISIEEAHEKANQETTVGGIYRQILITCVTKRGEILAKFPRLNRFLTGYDLEHAFDDIENKIDAGRLIAGAEGSLGFIAEAKLNITRIPKHTTLVNIKYDKFESALRHAPSMIAANATSVETVDSKVLNLARADLVWHSVSALISDVPNKLVDGLNMVEYNSDDKNEIDTKIQTLCDRLDAEISNNNENGVIGYQITSSIPDILKVYGMRKKAVGLLGKTKGSKKPIAFAEDTAVPPEHLADFIMEFRALLDSHELDYGMFGHVDAGVLHVRPALDMCDPAQEQLMNTISHQVVALVAKYGGLMWGEHGKGYRSEFAPAFFGQTLYDELRKIKRAFDPHNQMNPGKICTPFESQHELVRVSDTKRATFDRQIPIAFKNEFEPAMSCNGNGLCFNYDTTSPMCPSSKITQDRRHSPKGRAGLIREWLLQLSQQGVSAQTVAPSSFKSNIFAKWLRSFSPKDDFNHEVFDAMNGCLACKSCSSQCPVGVDVPDFRAKFLAIYYTRYTRPLKDYFVANVETLTPLMAKAPRTFNALVQSAPASWLLRNVVGYVDTPMLSSPTITKRVKGIALVCNSQGDLKILQDMPNEQRQQHVLIVQDPFTSFYDADVVEKLAMFIKDTGKTPVLLPFSPNGKPQHVKGFLAKFEKTVKQTATFLTTIAQLNIPMVGADASLVLCYRDEYAKILSSAQNGFQVNTITEWLSGLDVASIKVIDSKRKSQKALTTYKLLAHCSEKTALPETEDIWQQIFSKFGLTLNIASVGCCGMAGTYGHELEHFENSKGIYELSWSQHATLPQANNDSVSTLTKKVAAEQILVTGYSCRSQVKRFEQYRPKHPIEVLATLLR
ncbi:MAG: FAD/FMN-containing dehydrogenase/Fe-S oxidoreductase [Kangiellaceae bacterium]